jgi:hypothetical protein
MNRKRWGLLITGILLAAALLLYLKPWGSKPFADPTPEQIVSAEVFMIPPDQTIPLHDRDEIAELCEILKEITIYEADESGRDYAGQLVQAAIVLTGGTTHTIGAYGSFLFLNDTCYRTKYEPSEKLNSFGNGLRE